MEKLKSKTIIKIITVLLFGFFMSGAHELYAQTTPSNPQLTLQPGQAKLLGQYRGSILAGCENKYPSSITDYSGYVLDTTRNSILMFGGGHAAIPRTDVDVLDLNQATFLWKSDYAPTPVADQVPANYNSLSGSWISTGHPTSRHTYDMLTYAPNVKELIMLAGHGPQPACGSVGVDTSNPGKVWHYNSSTKKWTAGGDNLWPATEAASAAEYDPVSGKIFIVSRYAIYMYDPLLKKTTKVKSIYLPELYYAMNLVYYPPNQRMYYLNSDGTVFELSLDRNDFSKSTIVKMSGVSGDLPPRPLPTGNTDEGETGFAYDEENQIIGGGILNGVFYAFDPMAKKWSSAVIPAPDPKSPVGSIAVMHTIVYSPKDKVFVFMSRYLSAPYTLTYNTWAYRYQSSDPVPPPNPAPTVILTANPTSVSAFATSTLSWSSTNSTSCITPWGATATSGTFTTPPLSTTTSYSITCAGTGGSKASSIAITVTSSSPPPPTTTSPLTPGKYRSTQKYLFQTVSARFIKSPIAGLSDYLWDRYGPTYKFVDLQTGWPWEHPGGDWLDSNLVSQGSSPWFSIPSGEYVPLNEPRTYQGDVTNLISYCYKSGKWCAILLTAKNASRTIASSFHPQQAPPKITVVYKDGSSGILGCRIVAASSPSSMLPATTFPSIPLTAFLEFERPLADVQAATLSLVVVEHWSGTNPRIEGFLLDPPVNSNPVAQGVAATAGLLDEGITAKDGIIGAHRYLNGTKYLDFAVPYNYNTSDKERNFDPAIYGTGPKDLTKLPYYGANKWINPGDTWSLVDSNYQGEGFKPLADGLGAMRLDMKAQPGVVDGSIVGSAGTGAGDGMIFLPEPLYSNLDHIFVRYYFRLGTPYQATVANRKLVYHDTGRTTADWTTYGGKFGIVPDGVTSYGGYSGSSGGGNGWQMRSSWSDNEAESGGPNEGGWAVGNHMFDFYYANPPGYNYGHSDPIPAKGGSEFWGLGGLNLLYAGQWYCIETELKLNTIMPGGFLPDGEQRTWIDGRLAYESVGMVFRTTPNAFAYNPELLRPIRTLGVRGIKLNWFHGGKTPSTFDRTTFYTGVVWSKKYIGPMNLDGETPLPDPIDTTPPSVPANLRSSNVTQTSATISWDAANDNVGVAKYVVYRNNIVVANIVSTTYSDTNLLGGTTYIYAVEAVDSAQNISTKSQNLSIKTKSPPPPPTSTIPPLPVDFHVLDSAQNGTNWYNLINSAVPWKNLGGDFSDKNGVPQGPTPWATAQIALKQTQQVLNFNVTDLVKKYFSSQGQLVNRGWIIKTINYGGVEGVYCSKEYSDPAKVPQLKVVTTTGTYLIKVGADAWMARSTVYSTPSVSPTMQISPNGSVAAVWFDISQIKGEVLNAVMTLQTTNKQYGYGVTVLGVYPVDLAVTK